MPGASRVGDKAQATIDLHAIPCPLCPHSTVGPALVGSQDVLINSRPGLRVGDLGIHSVCCGPNTWVALKGSSSVFINGRPAMRTGDPTQHCGGVGRVAEGSPDVIIGG